MKLMCSYIAKKIKLPRCWQKVSVSKTVFVLIVGLVLIQYLYSTTTTEEMKSLSDVYFLNGIRNSFSYITSTNSVLPWCPERPPNLVGGIPIIQSPVPSMQELEQRFSWLKPGGHWSPDFCRAKEKVAIVVPFRDRNEHLLLFLQHMHPFLRKQQLDYRIFVVEQDDNESFNRAMLMNVGSYEAVKIDDYDCFIWHDVDLLPENDTNLYTCPEQPTHMSVAIAKYQYRFTAETWFGGVSAMSRKHFELVNGFSNQFWGWGGEDDDMYNRIKYHHLNVTHRPVNIARYTNLKHKEQKGNDNRFEMLRSSLHRSRTDGLNSLKHKIKETKHFLLYTWYLVKLR